MFTRSKKIITGAAILAGLISSSVYAANQTIVSTPASFSGIINGDTVQFTVNYPNTNPDATGMGLKIYYDSSKLTPTSPPSQPGVPVGLSAVNLPKIQGVQALPDATNDDGDASTDKYFLLAWAATSALDPVWNPSGENLVTVTFTASAGMTSNTSVNFTGEAAAGNTFVASNIPVSIPAAADNTPPVVTAPAAVTMEATGPTTAVALGTGTANDDVDGALVPTPNPAGPFAVGVHTVTWSATDAGGNTGTDTQQVTVTDTTAPTVTAPADLTATQTGVNTPVALVPGTAVDLVDGAIVPTPSTTGPFPVGATTVTWSATDSHGNTGTATQTVTITAAAVDNTPPVVTAPADVSMEATGATTAVALGSATATDDVDGAITATPSPAGPYSVGVHTITWTATDAAGNAGTDTQQVTVTDTTPPTVVAPSNKTAVQTGANTPVSLGVATATDLVDGALVPTADNAGPFPLGTTTVTWSVTDGHGNTGTAQQTVTITTAPVDTTPPTILLTMPQNAVVDLAEGETEVTIDFSDVTATDAVDGNVAVSWDQGGAVGSLTLGVGTHTIVWTATDEAGNTNTTTQTIEVRAFGAAGPGPAQNVPTLSEWAIILLSLLLGFASWVSAGRRKA